MHRADRRVIIMGSGGHMKVVVDVLRSGGWEPAGILDPCFPSAPVCGVPVIGTDEDAADLRRRGFGNAFVALGRNDLRARLSGRLLELGFELPNAIHPTACISPSATLGVGVAVMPNAVINAKASIGDLVIVNTSAIVEHDCRVGEASHVAPRSALGGCCRLGREVLFGLGAVARAHSIVGDRAIVGVGATVIGSVASGSIVVGNPARPLGRALNASKPSTTL